MPRADPHPAIDREPKAGGAASPGRHWEVAEYLDLSLGDLVEGVVLHAFEGKTPFQSETLLKIEQLKAVYGLTLTAADAHKLDERS